MKGMRWMWEPKDRWEVGGELVGGQEEVDGVRGEEAKVKLLELLVHLVHLAHLEKVAKNAQKVTISILH